MNAKFAKPERCRQDEKCNRPASLSATPGRSRLRKCAFRVSLHLRVSAAICGFSPFLAGSLRFSNGSTVAKLGLFIKETKYIWRATGAVAAPKSGGRRRPPSRRMLCFMSATQLPNRRCVLTNKMWLKRVFSFFELCIIQPLVGVVGRMG